MVSSCCVLGCTVRGTTGSGFRFYRFPNAKKKSAQRQTWITAVKRTVADPSNSSSIVQFRAEGAIASGLGQRWSPKKCHYVCLRHFVTGKIEAYTLQLLTPLRPLYEVQSTHILLFTYSCQSSVTFGT